MKDSFSAQVKSELTQRTAAAFGLCRDGQPPADDCCRLTFFSALLLFSEDTGDTLRLPFRDEALCDLFATAACAFYSLSPATEAGCVTLKKDAALLRVLRAAGLEDTSGARLPLPVCPSCAAMLLRALFCYCGTVTAPDKPRQLLFYSRALTDTLFAFLLEHDFFFRIGTRRAQRYLYLKRGEEIEDFLAFIGAQTHALELMNQSVERSVSALVNRQNNFDTANISRGSSFSTELRQAVASLRAEGRVDSLPPPERELLYLFERYPEESLAQLGEHTVPPLSKSGVYHRAKKLIARSKQQEV